MSTQPEALDLSGYPSTVATTLTHERAGRYAKQMISHWRNNPEKLETDENSTTMYFAQNDAETKSILNFDVTPDEVVMTIGAQNDDYAFGVAEVISEHLHRFAGTRDTLEIEWTKQT